MLRLQTLLLAESETVEDTLREAYAGRETLYKSGLAHYQAFSEIVIG